MAYEKVLALDEGRWVKLSFVGGGHRLTLGPSLVRAGWKEGVRADVEVDVDLQKLRIMRVDYGATFETQKGRGGIYIQLPKVRRMPVPAKPLVLDVIAVTPEGIEVEVPAEAQAQVTSTGEVVVVETVPDDDGDFPPRGTAFGDWINAAVDKAVTLGAALGAAKAAVLDQDMDYWQELMASETSLDDAAEEICSATG